MTHFSFKSSDSTSILSTTLIVKHRIIGHLTFPYTTFSEIHRMWTHQELSSLFPIQLLLHWSPITVCVCVCAGLLGMSTALLLTNRQPWRDLPGSLSSVFSWVRHKNVWRAELQDRFITNHLVWHWGFAFEIHYAQKHYCFQILPHRAWILMCYCRNYAQTVHSTGNPHPLECRCGVIYGCRWELSHSQTWTNEISKSVFLSIFI